MYPIVQDYLRAKHKAEQAKSPAEAAKWNRRADAIFDSMTASARRQLIPKDEVKASYASEKDRE